jgi:hypothetical protein
MPETSQDERGRRVFQLQRERAVEDAITRMRSNLGLDWKLFSAADIEILQNILGEAWITTNRGEWGSIAFSRMGVKEIQQLIDLGKGLRKGEREKPDTSREFLEIVHRTLRE